MGWGEMDGQNSFQPLEMSLRNDYDKRHGALDEIDYDALLALDGFDATDTTLERSIDNKDFAGVFEFLEFVGSKYPDVLTIGLERMIEIG